MGDFVLVSSCLLGEPCRYDARARPDVGLEAELRAQGVQPLARCAELLGGLPTPRPPAEIVGGEGADVLDGTARVLTDDGTDVTPAFIAGAVAIADEAVALGVRRAILQARSPSCGCGLIYDGTHRGRIAQGDGVTTAALTERGISVETRRGEPA